jgi:predicted AlkP superfamily phosphohydrolase/phosphomutase
MRLPRWTVWPALAVLAVFVVPAVTRPAEDVPAKHPAVIVLGIDGLDPDVLREAIERFPEHTPNWLRLSQAHGIHELATSTPPQSPVAWSNFITGLDPGGHGIFDFIHRDPLTRAPKASTVVEDDAGAIWLPGPWRVPLGGDAESNRSGQPFWATLRERGVPADVWRMPANFPVEPSAGWSFSGMMTPAVDSAYGEHTLYTSSPDAQAVAGAGGVVGVREFDGRIDTFLSGPANPFRDDARRATIPLAVRIDREARAVAIEVGGRALVVEEGGWSAFTPVSFDLLPLSLAPVPGIVRFHLKRIDPVFELYASPVNIDPQDPIAPVSAPEEASAEVARRIGPYYTQGMPEDVNALKAGSLDDQQFLGQADLVHAEGVRMLDFAFERWKARGRSGLVFFYFSGIDLCGHMLWRHADGEHPHHDARFAAGDSSAWSGRPGSAWRDVILDLYLRMDPIVGRVLDEAGDDALVVVMSDHGFASYRRKFSLNTWLLEQGYLVLKDGRARELAAGDPARQPVYLMDAVDWSRTRAYGIGFNGLYLNLAGRERDDPETEADESGIVQPKEADALAQDIAARLLALRDGDAQPVLRVDRARDVYRGERADEAPDLVVGYAANYGNSDESALGRIPREVLADNLGGTFNGNHLMAPEVVPGVLLANRPVRAGGHSLVDLTAEILRQYGVPTVRGQSGSPVLE